MNNRIGKWVAAGVIYLILVIGFYYAFEDYLVDPEAEHDEHAIEINERKSEMSDEKVA